VDYRGNTADLLRLWQWPPLIVWKVSPVSGMLADWCRRAIEVNGAGHICKMPRPSPQRIGVAA
jgi:hypothetical protein